MNATELADVDRDVLTITTRGAVTWVTCTSGPDEVTVGPFPTTSITGALPDPPVTGPAPAAPTRALLETALAAAMKDGKDARARAEKAEKELEQAEGALAAYVSAQASRAAQPRPLTPDDITDEMVRRALDTNGQKRSEVNSLPGRTMRTILTAALTEPTRPEGAEELGELIGEYLDSTPGVDDKGMADFLAERGVRVTGAES